MRRLLLALIALTLLSGCGGVDGSLMATAVRNTKAAGGAEVAFQMTVARPAGGQPVVITGSGVEDLSGQRARMTMQVPGAGEMEVRSEGLVVYMGSDMLTGAVGKEWMKFDLRRAYESLGIDVGPVEQVGQGTSEQLRWLGEMSDGVSEEGREQVRGVETTHYSATVDLRRYPDKDMDKLIELIGESEFPMDVWIDDDQRIRRVEWEQTMGPGTPSGTVVAEYVRFGVPVDIDIPDDDDVFDATEIGTNALEQGLN
jgi:uncharacterized protein YceK